MKVRRIALTSELLERMPAEERAFFLLAGHIQNEVNSLNKVFTWCLNTDATQNSTELEALADGIQAQLYARLLAGKLFEAWQALNRSFFGTRISSRLEEKLHPGAQSGLKKLKVHFNNPKMLKRIRNSFAFHYSGEEFDTHWRSVAGEPNFEILVGGTVGNNLNVASEFVVKERLIKCRRQASW